VTTLKRISLLLALGACLAAAGCGSDDEKGDPIPADQVAALQGRLDETENRLANGSIGACQDILDDTMPEVGNILQTLPSSVDPDVRDALEQSFDNLWSMVESECQDRKPDEPAQTETQTQPETTTTETQTETTETTPPETDTETAPDQETLPPEGDGENNGAIPETGGNNGGGVGPGATKLKQHGKEKL
jgi:hypothetical protein